jgi:hypothetical protein
MKPTRCHSGKGIGIFAAAVFGAVSLSGILAAQLSEETTHEAYSEHEKIDPVEVNGPIFVDWPKPDVALVFTGEQDGFLEPCGCAGLENQKGG